MYGIVSLLDEQHNATVESIWSEFNEKFGVHGVHQTPVVHLSYHVAEQYDQQRLYGILDEIMPDCVPFTVHTHGLGIFTGVHPILYVAIGFDDTLYELQHKLYEAVHLISTMPHPLYTPERWVPHITLAEGDVSHEMLPDVIRLLSERDFYWEIEINNLSLLGSEEGKIHELHTQLMFGG